MENLVVNQNSDLSNVTNFSNKGFAEPKGSAADLLDIDTGTSQTEAINKSAVIAAKAKTMLDNGKLKDGGAYRSPFPVGTATFEETTKWLGQTSLRAARMINVADPDAPADRPNATVQRESPAGFYALVTAQGKRVWALCPPHIVEDFASKKITLETEMTVSLRDVILPNETKPNANFLILS